MQRAARTSTRLNASNSAMSLSSRTSSTGRNSGHEYLQPFRHQGVLSGVGRQEDPTSRL